MRYCKKLTWIIEKICFFTMVFMAFILFAQVIARYIFNSAFFWAEDSAIYLMVTTTFLAACIGVSNRSLTRIDFFISKLPERIRHLVEFIDNLLCGVCCFFLLYYSIPLIHANAQMKMVTLPFHMSLPYWLVGVSSTVMTIYFIILAIEELLIFVGNVASKGVEE